MIKGTKNHSAVRWKVNDGAKCILLRRKTSVHHRERKRKKTTRAPNNSDRPTPGRLFARVRCFCAVDVAAVMGGGGGGGPARLFRTQLALPRHHRRWLWWRRRHTCVGVGRGSRRCPLVTGTRVGRRSKCLPLLMALYTDNRRVFRSVAADRFTRPNRKRQLRHDKSYSIYLFIFFCTHAFIFFAIGPRETHVFRSSWRPPCCCGSDLRNHAPRMASGWSGIHKPDTSTDTAVVQVRSKWPNAIVWINITWWYIFVRRLIILCCPYRCSRSAHVVYWK